MKYVVIGLSITSSWGNGHATTFRSVLKALNRRGHDTHFLEKDVPYYACNRDLPEPDFCRLSLYKSNEDLMQVHADEVANADVVIVGSYVQQGVEVGEWVTKVARGLKAFYDIDTPVTLAKLERKDYEYLTPQLIPKYDLYLSFSGGPVLEHLEQQYNSPAARALFCSVDPDHYYPEDREMKWQMGYLGTYSTDRQPGVDSLLVKPAMIMGDAKFVVAGPQYPDEIQWPENLERIEHLPPADHRAFYNSQKYTLNITRADMVKAGHSPSVRLFEAAACGVPIISDFWEGLTDLFSEGSEILIAKSANQVVDYFNQIDEVQRKRIAANALQKVLERHTAWARAQELENYVQEIMKQSEPQPNYR
jgi:spore maturation protein CgeB